MFMLHIYLKFNVHGSNEISFPCRRFEGLNPTSDALATSIDDLDLLEGLLLSNPCAGEDSVSPDHVEVPGEVMQLGAVSGE